MLSDEAFQKLLFDLFCLWHDVRRHYDPPITHSEEEKMQKVKQMICKLLGEIDIRVKRIVAEHANPLANEQDFIEEWTMLTWNVLCITSRLQNSLQVSVRSTEDRVIFSKLNGALVELVNHTRTTTKPPPIFDDVTSEHVYDLFTNRLAETMHILHGLYRTLKAWPQVGGGQQSPVQIQHPQQQQQQQVGGQGEVEAFAQRLQQFGDQHLVPFVDMFKAFCNEKSSRLWQDVRQAQIERMIDLKPMPAEPIEKLVSFYSHMMYRLAILSARLQGFRYELAINRRLFSFINCPPDPVQPLSEAVFSALELLMSDCVLATEPSTNPILVTNNLFQINCGALARGVVFKQFDIQVIGEEQAEHVQSEMRSQRLLQRPTPIAAVPSAALLAMKPTSGVKRDARGSQTVSGQESSGSQQGANKKSDVNSKELVTIYPVFNSKNRYWAASYPHMLCTTRQKGGRSTNNSFQDLSPAGGLIDSKSSTGKRPIFYFHITATMFSPSGNFADAHTLSLPLTIATRRNQDCQVQRMMSSYTATCFWLYGCSAQDGLLLQWIDSGMSWEKFKLLFMQHFKVNAEVERGLQDRDFDLLQYKIQCNDCTAPSPASSSMLGGPTMDNGSAGVGRVITFKNMLCPHLRYECGSTNVRFSVWRGMLEVLQLFQDSKTNVRKLWEKRLIMGFLEFDQVDAILAQHQSALIMRLSFVTGGTVCITVKSLPHAGTTPMHLEPLDLKKLQAKCLKDYLRDICVAEKVKYIITDCDYAPVKISDVIAVFNDGKPGGGMEEGETSRKISSNVTHSGDIDAMQHITFTAMRIAVVTCKVKPPSADIWPSEDNYALESPGGGGMESKVVLSLGGAHQQQSSSHQSPGMMAYGGGGGYSLPAQVSQQDDFMREVIQLCRFHGKSKQELVELMERAPEDMFAGLTLSSSAAASLLSNSQQQHHSHHHQPQQSLHQGSSSGPGSVSALGSPYSNNNNSSSNSGGQQHQLHSQGGFASTSSTTNILTGTSGAGFLTSGAISSMSGTYSPTNTHSGSTTTSNGLVPIHYQTTHQQQPTTPPVAMAIGGGSMTMHHPHQQQHHHYSGEGGGYATTISTPSLSHETSPTASLLYEVINEEPLPSASMMVAGGGGGRGGDVATDFDSSSSTGVREVVDALVLDEGDGGQGAQRGFLFTGSSRHGHAGPGGSSLPGRSGPSSPSSTSLRASILTMAMPGGAGGGGGVGNNEQEVEEGDLDEFRIDEH